jgi:hypothetical protein
MPVYWDPWPGNRNAVLVLKLRIITGLKQTKDEESRLARWRSEEFAELLRRKAGVPDDSTHGDRVDWVVPWDGHDSPTVGHDDVLALPGDLEACFF